MSIPYLYIIIKIPPPLHSGRGTKILNILQLKTCKGFNPLIISELRAHHHDEHILSMKNRNMLTLNLYNPVYKPEIRFSQYVDLRLTSAKVLQIIHSTKLLGNYFANLAKIVVIFVPKHEWNLRIAEFA